MHVHFVGEPDDGISLSSHHARLLERAGCQTSFFGGSTIAAMPLSQAVCSEAGASQVAPHQPDSWPKPPSTETSRSAQAFAVHAVFNEPPDPALICQLLSLREMGVPVLRFWTGADLLWAQFHEPTLTAGRSLASAGAWQFCRSDATAARLAALGIQARRFPLFSARVWNGTPPQPLPQQFTALCYLPANRREFHGAELLDALTRWLPRVRFLILGGDRATYPGQSNVEPLGHVDDVIRSIQRSTVLLQARLDAAPSRLMIEALSLGRHVIANCPWSHCAAAKTADEFLTAIRQLQRDLTFNLIGREEVCRGHDRSIAASVLKSIFEAAAVPADLLSRLAAIWSPPPAPDVQGVAPVNAPAAFCCELNSAAVARLQSAADPLSQAEAAFRALAATGSPSTPATNDGEASGSIIAPIGVARAAAPVSARASA